MCNEGVPISHLHLKALQKQHTPTLQHMGSARMLRRGHLVHLFVLADDLIFLERGLRIDFRFVAQRPCCSAP